MNNVLCIEINGKLQEVKRMDNKIIQIINAPEKLAEYVDRDGYLFTRELTCLALTEDKTGKREIKGVYNWEGETCFCEDDGDFRGYVQKG